MIRDLLGTGKTNARTAAEMSQVSGLTAREVTRHIERMRQGGEIICADSSGYYYPDSPADASLYLRRRKLRTRTIIRATEAMQAALDTWIGQEYLDLDVL